MPKIPVNEPAISKNALKYVTNCIKTGWISSAGSYLNEFEEKFAKFLGVKQAITTTNGTTALHLALLALGIKKGDEVILPSHTMMSSAAAIVYTGATPVLVDVEPDTWNMDIRQIEEKINKRTKVIMPVHIYGHPVDMDPVVTLAKKYHLYIVEDAAESIGAEYKGKLTGTIGDIGCFSFYANKIITTGEGGMVATNNDKIAKHARLLKDLAHSPQKRFLHKEIGFNFRMTNMQAALGVAQLEEIKKYIQKKRRMADTYNKELSEIKGLTLPIERSWAKNVYWMYGIMVEKEFGITRDEFMKRLYQKGIETRTFFIPMHRQPALRRLGLFKKEKYPVSDDISRKGLYLPSGLTITVKQIRIVCKAIQNIKKEIKGNRNNVSKR